MDPNVFDVGVNVKQARPRAVHKGLVFCGSFCKSKVGRVSLLLERWDGYCCCSKGALRLAADPFVLHRLHPAGRRPDLSPSQTVDVGGV